MNLLAGLQGLLTGGKFALPEIAKIIKPLAGDRGQRDQAAHQENIATYDQFKAEFQNSGMTWFDRVVNGFNRLPRPVIVSLVILYFILSFVDPLLFQQINNGLDSVPDNMWIIAGGIISFYFVVREINHKRMSQSAKEFDQRMARHDALQERRQNRQRQAQEIHQEGAQFDPAQTDHDFANEQANHGQESQPDEPRAG
ncbi:MAG: 3TM-type holin [Pseudomonadota bacterium]